MIRIFYIFIFGKFYYPIKFQLSNRKILLMFHNTITMFYNYYEDYQYDSCVSKGICSIGPRTSSLQEILVMYLKLLAFFIIELKNLGGHNKDAEKVILDTISTLMTNLETQSEQFQKILISIKTLLCQSKKAYLNICNEKNITPKSIETNIKLDEEFDITKLIQQGEKEYNNRLENLSSERKNLFEVMAYIIKSLSINIVNIKSFSDEEQLEQDGFYKILILLNLLNYQNTPTKDILDEIQSGAELDYKLTVRLDELQSENYGEPSEAEVSISTRPGKAILVAGTSLRELEEVLEYTKDKNIDVYTHGEMIVAHTYPKFREYKHLIGHFGVGVENCLLDFATFPGAILITKYAVENIEYLYRGRLFTTDSFVPKGAIKIENNDYSKLIESAFYAKGFKRGKQKGTIQVGVSKDKLDTELNNFVKNLDKYKHIIIIGPENHNKRNKIYYENILNNMPENTFVISFSYNRNGENVIFLNERNGFSIIYYILEKLLSIIKNTEIDISIFISKCDKHTISNLIYLSKQNIKNIFLSKCTPIMLKPSLTKNIADYYDIKATTQPVDDLKVIVG